MIAILAGFVLAVGIGAAIMFWQAERARTTVRFGAVIATMAEATGDVLYFAAQFSQPSGAPGSSRRAHGQSDPIATAELREDLSAALERLRIAYDAFEIAVRGDLVMSESARITVEEGQDTLASDAATAREVRALVGGASIPPELRAIWEGDDDGRSLRNDIRDVISQANRLDIFEDFSAPAARRVLAQLKAVAKDRIRPNLATSMDRINEGTIRSYRVMQSAVVVAAAVIIACGALIGGLVFVPMMRNISAAHATLKEANASIDEARQRAESADRAKSEFLANMSHEIRTPMNGVLGMAELLSKTELDTRQSMFTDVILKSGQALLTIINDILDFSKIDAGQLELHDAPFKLADAIEDVATLVSARVVEKDLELIVRVDPELPSHVVGDVGRVRQVVTNLIGNAVKFTERGHVLVDVTGRKRDRELLLKVRVEDTGIGIPRDKLESVFEKFAQVDTSSTRRHEGTGLGLAITSRLVALMDGDIGVESEVGRGSTFWFEIPLVIAEAQENTRTLPVDVTGARVLVVDDNAVNRSILLEQLRSWGFDCAAAESGPVALAVLRQAAAIGAGVDAVILDYQMPAMNGAEVATAIRDDGAIRPVPVIMLTSVDQADFGRLLVEHKITAFLTKPARSSALLETLISVMQRSAAAKAVKRDAETQPSPVQQPVKIETPTPPAPAETTSTIRHFPSSVRVAASIDILVVEDNEVNQFVFGQILDGLGVSYKIAGNGRTGVEMHRSLRPKLILMDVSMPEMNGLEATAAIREHELGTGKRVPIIGVTAHALKGDREKCHEAGMDDYLSKPISPDALAAKIATWLPDASHARIA
ncbi:MAG: response regulator [Rhizobiaceae bacterium]|nr:response regulator [Rhizobiaceae bacterium]MCV0404621.1 response regulator [Rhizobiaceae bacterium]